MKKVVLLSLIVLTISSVSFAQNSKSFYRSSFESRNSGSFSQSHSLLSLGYGFANQFYPGYAYGYGNRFALGPVYLKYEHGFLRDDVGLGGTVSVAHAWIKYNGYNEKINITAFSIAFLGYYHFNKLIPVEKLDVYAGLGLSFWSRSGSNDNVVNYSSSSSVYPVVKVGARYYVKPKLGLYGEVGYDQMSALNLGVTFKL